VEPMLPSLRNGVNSGSVPKVTTARQAPLLPRPAQLASTKAQRELKILLPASHALQAHIALAQAWPSL
jgi:hypothetical protein